MSRKTEKFLKEIIRWGSYLILFLPLAITRSTLYPFIFGKIIFFRILVEIIFVPWIFLVIYNPKYRIKWKNPLILTLTIFVSVLFLTMLTGVDIQRSFWSTQERMTGILTLFHFWLWFIILSTTFKKWQDWKKFIWASLICSFLVGSYGLGQKLGWSFLVEGGKGRLASTLGNPIFLGVYSLINAFLAGFLLSKSNNKIKKIFSIFFLSFNSFILLLTASRTVFVVFIISLVTIVIYLISLFQSKKLRRLFLILTISLIIVVIAGVIFLNLQKKSNLSKKIPFFIKRVAIITYITHGLDQRIIPWKIAFKGFKERPIFGWGWENYNIIFNKHFIPKIYDKWGPQGSWFDRSHNQILDILALSGILGLFSYLAFYSSIFWFLFKKIKISNRKEKVGLFILFLVFIAYFLQNLTVFDTPAPLIVFYFALGLVYFTITENANAERLPTGRQANQDADQRGDLTWINTNSSEKINQFPLPILIFLIIIFVPWAIYKFNLEPYKQSKLGIIAISVSQNDLKSGIEWYKKALAKNCFTNPELRMQLVKSVIENSREQKISRENLREITEFAISEMKKSVKKHPLDVRYYLYLGELYNFASQFDRIYAEKAEELLTRGLKLSPKRQQIYYEIGRAQILQRKYIKAIETYKKVLEIDKKTKESYWNLGLAYLINKEYKKGLNNINQARKMGRSYQKNESVTLFIADAYAELKNYKQAIALCNLVLRWNPKNINALVRKVIYYSRSGDKKNVQKSLEELKKINPSVAQEVKKIIKQKNE